MTVLFLGDDLAHYFVDIGSLWVSGMDLIQKTSEIRRNPKVLNQCRYKISNVQRYKKKKKAAGSDVRKSGLLLERRNTQGDLRSKD